MRVERLDLISYGHLREVSLDFGGAPNGLTVIVGPNEAGKSTTMRALDALLFGIELRTGDHFGQGRPSLRIGARLTSADGSPLEVVRQGLNKAPLVDPAGHDLPESALLALTGHANRELFRTLFRVDHHELSTGSGALLEADGDIGRLVFGASLGSVALTDVLRELDARADGLFRPNARKTLANASLLNHRSLAREARDHRVKPKVWTELDSRRRATEADIAALTERQRQRRADEARLTRIGAALPLLTQRTHLLTQLDELTASGPLPPRSWADEVARLLADHDDATATAARAEVKRDGVVAQLEAVRVDEHLLANDARIRRLLEGSGRYRKDRDDLPKLEERLQGHRRTVEGLLVRLGEPPGTDPDALVVLTDAQVDQIGSLATERSRLVTRLDQAAGELHDLDQRITQARAQLGDLEQPADTTSLTQAVDAARALGPLDEQLARTSADLEQTDLRAKALISRMGYADTTLSEAVAQPVPTRARVQRERAARGQQLTDRTELDTRIRELENDRTHLLEEQTALESDLDLPDRADLAAVRRHRDEGWRLVRASLDRTADHEEVTRWAHGEPLTEAYEGAVERADGVADRRFEHAERITKIAANTGRLAIIDERLAACGHEMAELVRREQVTAEAWRDEWAHLGVDAGEPDDALEWLDDHRALIDLDETRQSIARERAELEQKRSHHGQALRAPLAALGLSPDDRTLGALLRQAEGELARATEARQRWTRARQHLDALDEQRPGREAEVARSTAELATWSTRWAAELAPIHLGPDTDPGMATTTVKLLLDLRKQRDDEKSDASRLRGLRTDVAGYEQLAASALGELAPDLADDDLATAISTLADRLEHANRQATIRQTLCDQRDALAREIDEAVVEGHEAARGLETQRAAASIAPDVELRSVLARALDAADLCTRLGGVDATLIAQGGGRSVAEIEHEAGEYDMDGDRVAIELISVGDELAELENLLAREQASQGEIDTLIGQIDGSAVAADLDQQAEDALAETAQHLDEYLRVTLASALLKRVVSDYGAQHQRPILDDAAAILRTLTLDGFVDLLADTEGDRQVLLAQRDNGERLRLSELSSGTRDQLYLALRLAGVRHHLRSVDEPLPLILDDLLVNFDDDRSAAALEVLAGLGACTQVLMFTHEQSLARLAVDTLGPERCSVVPLVPRDHDTR